MNIASLTTGVKIMGLDRHQQQRSNYFKTCYEGRSQHFDLSGIQTLLSHNSQSIRKKIFPILIQTKILLVDYDSRGKPDLSNCLGVIAEISGNRSIHERIFLKVWHKFSCRPWESAGRILPEKQEKSGHLENCWQGKKDINIFNTNGWFEASSFHNFRPTYYREKILLESIRILLDKPF